MDDRKLLRAFATTRSADAFAEIVRANAGIVYAAARRQLRDSALAEDITQAVFLLLSQKPRRVKGSIAGWLIVATRYACRDALKLARRREKHERRAAEMKPIAAVLLAVGVVGGFVASAVILTRQRGPAPVALQAPRAAPMIALTFPDAQPGPTGVAAPGPLTLSELLQRVQARDARLANRTYDLTSAETNVNTDGTKDALGTSTCSIRQEGKLYWLHLVSRKANGTLEGEEFANWDGKVARLTTHHPTMRAPMGLVDSEKSDVFSRLRYNTLLGFPWETFIITNGYVPPPIMKSASECLADAIAARDAELRWLPGGLAVVRIRQGQAYSYHRIMFDTTKGCAPVRWEFRYEYGSNVVYEAVEAVEMDRIDGAWIATSVLTHSVSSSTPLVETQFRDTISNFTIGKTTDADLALRFSPGMRINDEVAGVAYLIGTNGVLNQLPYEDEKTGRVTAVAAGAILTKPPTTQRFDAVIPPSNTAR